MARATIRNLAAGLKLALLLPVRGADFRPTLAGSLFNVVLSVLVLAVFSYAQQQGDIYFNDFAAAFVGALLFAALISAIAIVRARGSLDRLPDLITPISSLFPWMVGFLSCLHLYLDPSADSALPWSVALLWCVTIVHLKTPRRACCWERRRSWSAWLPLFGTAAIPSTCTTPTTTAHTTRTWT